jgi:hypothetical protein
MIQSKYDFNKIVESAFLNELEKISGILGSPAAWSGAGIKNFLKSSIGNLYGHTRPAKYFSGKLSNIETKKAAGGTLSAGEKIKRFGLKTMRSTANVTPLEAPIIAALHAPVLPPGLSYAYLAARPYAKKGILGLLSKFKKTT